MIEGLYKVSFSTPYGAGDGVVVLKDGRVFGGDSLMFYEGSYTVNKDESFHAQVLVTKHSKTPGFESVFGVDTVNLQLLGKLTEKGGIMSGKTIEGEAMPGFQARLAIRSRY
jgi:hypothetical protein